MPFDFSSYQVADHEHPASAGKYNNLIFAVQTGLNGMPVSSLIGYPGDAGKFLNGSGGWTLPSTDLAAVYRKTDPTTIENQNTPGDLFADSLAIAAGRLGALGSIRLFASGEFVNDTGSNQTVTFSLLLGGTPLWTGTAGPMQPDGDHRSWRLKAIIQALNSVTSQQGGGTLLFSHSDKAATGLGNIRASNVDIVLGSFLTAATSVNMAATQTLAFQVTFPVKSNVLWMKCTRARVEVTV